MITVPAIVDGKIVTVRLPSSVLTLLESLKPASPPPETNGVWTVGDRVHPIGWVFSTNIETGETSNEPTVATVVRVTDGGVHVEFGPEVTKDGTTVPFFFVNECVEMA